MLWCVAIDRAVHEDRLDGVHDGLELLEPSARAFWAARIREATEQPPETFRPNGWVVTAFQAAYAAIIQTPEPHDDPPGHLDRALQTAVGIGDDTDTVAAIAGALLGARWGASAVPTAWRKILHGWPGYRTGDLRRLARTAAGLQEGFSA